MGQPGGDHVSTAAILLELLISSHCNDLQTPRASLARLGVPAPLQVNLALAPVALRSPFARPEV